MTETAYQRIGREQQKRQNARNLRNHSRGGFPNETRRKAQKRESLERQRIADHIDGFDRDDLCESPDF